jgi:hypothetical protein
MKYIITLLVSLLSLCLLSYKTNSTHKGLLLSIKSKNDSDITSQVGVSLANGYTGESSIFISADSIHYEAHSFRIKYDTCTPKDLWVKISNASNFTNLSKIISGKTEQDRDGTDTIYYVRAKSQKHYSFANAYGNEFDKQKEFESLLITQLTIYGTRALKNKNNRHIANF